MLRTNRFGGAAIIATLLFASAACVNESTQRGSSEIGYADASDRFETRSIERVTRGDVVLGEVERTLVRDNDSDDRNDRYVWLVYDESRERVGYVTDDMQAFRFRAYSSRAERVSHALTLDENIMAVYGYFDGSIEREKLTAPYATPADDVK